MKNDFIDIFGKCFKCLIDSKKIVNKKSTIYSKISKALKALKQKDKEKEDKEKEKKAIYELLEEHYVPLNSETISHNDQIIGSHSGKRELEVSCKNYDFDKIAINVLDLNAHWFLEDMARNLVVKMDNYDSDLDILIIEDNYNDLEEKYEAVKELLSLKTNNKIELVTIESREDIDLFKDNPLSKELKSKILKEKELKSFRYIFIDLLIGNELKGFDLIKKLKEIQEDDYIKYCYEIIVVSRSLNTEDIQKAFNYGASLYIPKERIFSIPYKLAQLGHHNPEQIDFSNTFRLLSKLAVHYIKKLQNEVIKYQFEQQKSENTSESQKDNPDYKWLQGLPKADLHFHLGGALDSKCTLELSYITLAQYLKRYNDYGAFDKGFIDEDVENIKDIGSSFFNEANAQEMLKEICKCANYYKIIAEELSGLGAKDKYKLKKVTSAEKFFEDTAKKYESCFPGLKPFLITCFFNIFMEGDITKYGKIDKIPEKPSKIKYLHKLIQATHGNSLHNAVSGITLASFLKGCDYTGSDVIQTRAVLKEAIKTICEDAQKNNIVYLSVRFTPMNFTKGGLSEEEVWQAITEGYYEFINKNKDKDSFPLLLTFIIAIKRHYKGNEHELKKNIEFGIGKRIRSNCENFNIKDSESLKKYFPCVTGFDLTGLEENFNPGEFRKNFHTVFDACMPITIHAGEETPAKFIWEAAYELNADRVGHGLSLINEQNLLGRFRDFDKCIELCPTSNYLTQEGFTTRGDTIMQNSTDRTTIKVKEYPSGRFLKENIGFVVCTDDPAIQNSDINIEYLWLSHLTVRGNKSGITKWEVLKLIRNSFKYSFLPNEIKRKLLQYVDNEVFRVLMKHIDEKNLTLV